MERTDDKTKSSKNEEIRLRLGSTEPGHGQNHLPQYRLNNQGSHKTYKGKRKIILLSSQKLELFPFSLFVLSLNSSFLCNDAPRCQ